MPRLKVNKYALKPAFKNVEELRSIITKYYSYCKTENRPLTVSGLANAIKVNRSWMSVYDAKIDALGLWTKDEREEIKNELRMARERVQQFLDEYLLTGKNVVGAIFNLKNNFGWQDKNELGVDASVTVKWIEPKRTRKNAKELSN